MCVCVHTCVCDSYMYQVFLENSASESRIFMAKIIKGPRCVVSCTYILVGIPNISFNMIRVANTTLLHGYICYIHLAQRRATLSIKWK